MNEHGFVKSVHKKLPTDLYKWKIHDSYTNGVPDAMYAGNKSILFVEYKYVPKLPSKASTPVKVSLSGLQTQWLNNFYDLGHNVAVIVGTENRQAVVLQHKTWSSPLPKETFEKNCVPFQEITTFILEVCTSPKKCIMKAV